METVVIGNMSDFRGGSKWLNYQLPGGGRDGNFYAIPIFVEVLSTYPLD